MLDKSNNNVIWQCDNCGDIMPAGYKAYHLPDGTVLCDAIGVEGYAFMHNDDSTREDSDVLAEVWNAVETFIIPQ